MPQLSPRRVSVGKLCLPASGCVRLYSLGRCSCEGGNSVINKLSVHFRRQLFLLFSHNMLSCFSKKQNKTKSGRPRVPPSQGGPKAVFEVGASVLLVLSLVLVALAQPPCSSVPSQKGRRRTCLGAVPGASRPSQESFLHQGAVGGRLVLHWDWKRGDFGDSREENKNLSSLLPSPGQCGDIEAAALAATERLFLTISETKSSSVG